MTIIQAQPLKQFGISGPISALDNEVPIFDGITGKKIKAATGIICPSSGRLDLAEIRAKDGNGLKLYEDGGAGIFVKDGGNVGIGTDSPGAKLQINQSEDNNGIRLYGHDDVSALYGEIYIDSTGRLNLNSQSQHMYFKRGGVTQAYITTIGMATLDDKIFQFGSNSEDGSIGWNSADNSLRFVHGQVLTTNVRMVINSDGNIGISTTAPSAKLDINSDIIRLRTAKTPASAGAAGNQGDECWDANYCYRCVATNTWKRTALTTW